MVTVGVNFHFGSGCTRQLSTDDSMEYGGEGVPHDE